MSRSQPINRNPHPSTRWFEWKSKTGDVSYYDKDAKVSKTVDDFVFIPLDQTATIRGWDDASSSSIYSNEIRDARTHRFVVKSFKGTGILAEGVYSEIKDRIKAKGGHYVANIHIAYNDDGEWKLGTLQYKGSALGAWMEFSKENRDSIYTDSVKITGSNQQKKGSVVFFTPIFSIGNLDDSTKQEATKLDTVLQEYLKGYFKRDRVEQAEAKAQEVPAATDDDEIPF